MVPFAFRQAEPITVAIPDDILTTLKPEPFEAIKSRVRDGDLLLCSGTATFSRLIRWATMSPWSHVALAYRWPQVGRIMVFESVEKIGVRTVPLSRFISRASSGKGPFRARSSWPATTTMRPRAARPVPRR